MGGGGGGGMGCVAADEPVGDDGNEGGNSVESRVWHRRRERSGFSRLAETPKV